MAPDKRRRNVRLCLPGIPIRSRLITRRASSDQTVTSAYNPSVLTTARLRLRSWRDEDLEPFAALNTDPRVREFFTWLQTPEESAESMQYICDHFRHHGFGLWAVEVIGAAPFIGFIGLSVPSFDAPFMPCVELGYRLAFEYWGRGYATEGARAAIAFGFATMGLAEISP